MDLLDFGSQIDINAGNSRNSVGTDLDEMSKSVLTVSGDFELHIGIKSGNSRKSLRTHLDEIRQIRSDGLWRFRIADCHQIRKIIETAQTGFRRNCPNPFWWIMVLSDRRLTSKQEAHERKFMEIS